VFENGFFTVVKGGQWRVLRLGNAVLLHSLTMLLLYRQKDKFYALRSAVLE
jgi:hypothetical protein